MKLNFAQIKTTDLEGQERIYDVSKSLGNIIYQATGDLGMLAVAQEMYKKGQVELDGEAKKAIVAILQSKHCPLVAIVKQTLITQLNGTKDK